MTNEQKNLVISVAPDLLETLRTIAANAASVQMDPQWAVRIARDAIEDLRGIRTQDAD